MTQSEKLLRKRYGQDALYLTTEQLAQVFRYQNSRCVIQAIYRGTFPVKTQRIANRRMAYLTDVAAYLERQRKKAK